MSEDRLLHYVRLAIELQDAGETVDLDVLCRDEPELIEPVRETLALEGLAEPHRDGLLGQKLNGRYLLHDCIGFGAMGAVYAATDESLQRTVAVKLLPPTVFGEERRRERFNREARVLATLKHPNIVPVHDYGRSEQGLHYLVMERLQGCPLSAVTAETGSLPEGMLPPFGWLASEFGVPCQFDDYIPQVVAWMVQICQALSAAHDAGVYHRDVKPSNVFLTREGPAVLLDFGIAARHGEASMTTRGSALGTPAYMAPEQIAREEGASATMDVYGVCATLYHLAARKPPYEGDSLAVLARLPHEDPRPLRSIAPYLPIDLCAIVEKGLERDPARRYQDIADLEADLRAFLAHLPVQARPITGAARLWRQVRRRPAMMAVPGLVAAVAVVSIWMTMSWTDAAARRGVEHDRLFAALPPNLALEGTIERRKEMNRAERADHIRQLDAIVELDPDDVHTRTLRSALHQDQGDETAAAADIAAILGDPASDYQRELLARYRAFGSDAVGVGDLDLANLPEPTTDLGRFLAGFHHYRVRNWAAADEALAAAAEYLPARYLRLGVRLHAGMATEDRIAKEEQHRPLCRDASMLERELGGPTTLTHYIRGSALVDLGDFDAGILELEQALALQPRSFGILNNLAASLRLQGRPDRAEPLLRRASALRPWLLNARLQIASNLSLQRRFEEAMQHLDELDQFGEGDEGTPADIVRVRCDVEAERFLFLLGQERRDEATAAAQRIAELCRQGLAMVGDDQPDARRTFQFHSVLTQLALADDRKALEAILSYAAQDTRNPTLLRACAELLENQDFELDEPRQGILDLLIRLLRAQSDALAPRPR